MGTAFQVVQPLLPVGGQPPSEILGVGIGADGTDQGGIWEIERQDTGDALDLLTVGATSTVDLTLPLLGAAERLPPLALGRWQVDSSRAVTAARPQLGPPPYSLDLRNFSLDGPPYWVVTDPASRSVKVDAESGGIAP